MHISAVFLAMFALSVSSASVPFVSKESSVGSSLKLISKIYDDCSRKDSIATCLKGKAIKFFDRAITSDELTLGDVVLVKDEASRADYGRALTDGELEEVMGENNVETRDNALNKLLFDRIARLFNSHTMKLSLPQVSSEDIARSVEEGRGKMKKMMSMMMMAGSMKMMMLVPIAIGALFLLAGKALIISKIALVLALIITLKKLLGGKQGGHEMHGWSSGGGGGGGHGGGGGWDKRSLGNNDLAHDLAYNSYAAN